MSLSFFLQRNNKIEQIGSGWCLVGCQDYYLSLKKNDHPTLLWDLKKKIEMGSNYANKKQSNRLEKSLQIWKKNLRSFEILRIIAWDSVLMESQYSFSMVERIKCRRGLRRMTTMSTWVGGSSLSHIDLMTSSWN